MVKIYNPDENGVGEICVKGRNVFMGYLKNEDENKREFNREGLLHTGDLGYIDKDGCLQITGRLKEILITAGGENVVPQPIEKFIKEKCPIISHCVLIGDERKFLSLLITLKVQFDNEGNATNKLDQSVQSYIYRKFAITKKIETTVEARNNNQIRQFIQSVINDYNQT